MEEEKNNNLNENEILSQSSEKKFSLINKILSCIEISEMPKINKIVSDIKNYLTFLLAEIKQNSPTYASQRENIERIQFNLEEIIVKLENLSPEETKYPEGILGINYVLEKIMIFFKTLFEIDSNILSFLEIYCKFFYKIIKKIGVLCTEKSREVYYIFSSSLSDIFDILIRKKIECVDKIRDSKIILKITKIVVKLNEINEIYTEHFSMEALFNFFLISRENVFFLCSDTFVEEFDKIIVSTCKFVLSKSKNTHEIKKFSSIFFEKIYEIAKSKEDLRSSLEYVQQIYVVNTLILCLKMICIIIDLCYSDELFRDFLTENLTRALVELSFWDNSSIVDYSCRLFNLLWSKATVHPNSNVKSQIEKIMDFIFVRRYQNYLQNIESNDSIIKISVLEIVTQNLNYLIKNQNFLLYCFINYDFISVRYNFLGQIFTLIKNYFSLNHSKFNLLKRLLVTTYKNIFDFVEYCITKYRKLNSVEEVKIDDEFVENHHRNVEIWSSILKALNYGKNKNFVKKLAEIIKKEINPKDKDNLESLRPIAKKLAIFIKNSYYIEIDKLHEVFGQKDEFSKMILKEYLSLFDFRNIDIVKAYRIFVSTFKLGGESDVIYNLISGFAERYFTDNNANPIFKNEEEVCLLAYAIVMLNTDLHNPLIKDHMNIDGFIKNVSISGLEIPSDYLKKIFKSIENDGMRIPEPRLYDFSKYDEIYDIIHDKKSISINGFTNYEPKSKAFPNSLNLYMEKKINEENFILIDCIEDFSFEIKNETFRNPIFISVIYLFWEEFFYNFMTLSYRFFELNDENIFKIVKSFCSISECFNQKENIDKLVISINQVITSDNIQKTNLLQLYNIFFTICVDHSKNYQSYLEIYFNSLINTLKHKVFYEPNDLSFKYYKFIDEVILKTYNIIVERARSRKTNTGSYFLSFFSNKKEENEIDFEKYKEKIWTQIDYHQKRDHIIENSNIRENSAILVPISKMIELIKNQEEEYIFFSSFAASKILNYADKSEIYFSLIFLNEMCEPGDKKFMKIWPNLLNITRDKLDFKSIFEQEENLFDSIFLNQIITEIMSKYMDMIDFEDYKLILEKYVEIDNIDILLMIIETNNKLLSNLNASKIFKKDDIFCLVFGINLKILSHYSSIVSQGKNQEIFDKLLKSIKVLIGLFKNFHDFSQLSNESFDRLNLLFKIINEYKLLEVFIQHSKETTLLIDFIEIISSKVQPILPAIEEEKWEFYMKIIENCFCSITIENEEIQKPFSLLISKLLKKPPIPLVKFKELSIIITQYLASFINLKVKFKSFWTWNFCLFEIVFKNNENLFTSSSDFEILLGILTKYLGNFIDYNKKSDKQEESDCRRIIEGIFTYLNEKIKANNLKSNSWESVQNLYRIYFSESK